MRQSTWLRYLTYFRREGELVSCGQLRWCFCLSPETGLHSANCAKAGDSTAQFFVGRCVTVVAQRPIPLVLRPKRFSICSSLTRCSMSVGRSSNFGCRLGADSRDPTVAARFLSWTRLFTACCCATTVPLGSDVKKTVQVCVQQQMPGGQSAGNCDASQLLFSRCGADRGVMPQIMEIVQVFSLLDWVPQVHFWRL